MESFFIRWMTTTIGVLAAAQLHGIRYESWISLAMAALFLGIVNALVRPVILLLSLPLILLTFGFFILIVNAFMLQFVAWIVPGFYVQSFGSAFFGAIVISVVGWLLRIPLNKSKVRFHSFTEQEQFADDYEIKKAKARVVGDEKDEN